MIAYSIFWLVASCCATSPLWSHRPTWRTLLFSAAFVLPWLLVIYLRLTGRLQVEGVA